MPLYDYECEGGHRFEEVRSMKDRHNTNCPECKKPAHIRISAWGRVIFAAYDTVVGHDGVILSRRQSTERTPMLPEKVHGGRW